MLQTILVVFILGAAIGYALFRIWYAFKAPVNPCDLCPGCPLKQPEVKNKRNVPPPCSEKKVGKNLSA